MPRPPSRGGAILLAIPLLFSVGCTTDSGVEPLVPDDFLVTAEAGKKVGQSAKFVYEPQRWEQNRKTLEWHRFCQANSYEDLDGNDFYNLSPDGISYRKDDVNEKDGFVLIKEENPVGGPRYVTHIGRAVWDGTFWWSGIDGVGTPGTVNSTVAGVVFPTYAETGNMSAEVAELLWWLDGAEPEPGSYPEDGSPPVNKVGIDLLNEPLGPIPANHPNPQVVHGTSHGGTPRAITRVNKLLAEAEDAGTLQGVRCRDLKQSGVIFQLSIDFEKNWPKSLKKLF